METPLISVHWRFPADAAKRVSRRTRWAGAGSAGEGCWDWAAGSGRDWRRGWLAARVVAVGVNITLRSVGGRWMGWLRREGMCDRPLVDAECGLAWCYIGQTNLGRGTRHSHCSGRCAPAGTRDSAFADHRQPPCCP